MPNTYEAVYALCSSPVERPPTRTSSCSSFARIPSARLCCLVGGSVINSFWDMRLLDFLGHNVRVKCCVTTRHACHETSGWMYSPVLRQSM